MAEARNILKRTKTVKTIRAITNATAMMATARFKRAYDLLVAARPFAERLAELVGDLVARGAVRNLDAPLLHESPGPERVVLIVLTSNTGLCGGHNAGVLRIARRRLTRLGEARREVNLRVVGGKGIQRLRSVKPAFDRQHARRARSPDYGEALALARELMAEFLAGRISGVEVAYVQFISVGSQAPAVARILPLSEFHPAPRRTHDGAAGRQAYELQPSGPEMLRHLLPTMVHQKLYQCFLDSAVSEQAARMTAMRAATDNADELIHSLTIRYNRQRQSRITTELAEIMSGRTGMGN